MTQQHTRGIHHVTAIATDARANVDFYSNLLGLRLVKKTVNFDDPGTYHLYYGDTTGRPGTLLTFFPWRYARRGSQGVGQVSATGLAIPEGSLGWWRDRVAGAGAIHGDPTERFGAPSLTVLDPDGMRLELIEDASAGDRAPWGEGPVPESRALRGIHSVTLTVADGGPTAQVLETLGFRSEAVEQTGARERFRASGEESEGAVLVDLVRRPGGSPGTIAAGSVHHVAWRASTDDEQRDWIDRLRGADLHPTTVQDRSYFRSIYFREPGGILFEIATDGPGFLIDESAEDLGASLRLPAWAEARRSEIEARLPPLSSTDESRAAEDGSAADEVTP